jgi:hypothetical protein
LQAVVREVRGRAGGESRATKGAKEGEALSLREADDARLYSEAVQSIRG